MRHPAQQVARASEPSFEIRRKRQLELNFLEGWLELMGKRAILGEVFKLFVLLSSVVVVL